MADPTLMFCVGATKAGTSWLYDYLHGHEECVMQSVKEAHFFDTISRDRMKPQIDEWKTSRDVFRARKADAIVQGDDARRARVQAKIDGLSALIKAVRKRDEGIDDYLAYIKGGSEGARLVGDITPSYALLDDAVLERMSHLADDVKFVFLMRDPIDRLWSHTRMIAKRRAGNTAPTGTATLEAKARAILKSVAVESGEEHIAVRGDYPSIVTKLKRVIPEDRLHFEFFERLLTEKGLRDLCDFLGLSFVPGETTKKVHEGVRLSMDDEMLGWAAEFTAPHYAFVKETFGALPERWNSNMVRV